jgi:dipeptidyl aminopeptidase/acylaminoacyl peptidase
MRHTILAAAVIAALWVPLSGRSNDTPLDAAAFAWDRGDYVSALTTYLQILDANPSDDAIETIALQTGELFQTTELTADGDAPQFSPDGRFIAYETGTVPKRTIRLLGTGSPGKPIATLPGYRASFSPDSTKLAYVRIPSSPAIEQAATAASAATPEERAQRTIALNNLLAAESRLVVRDLASGQETELDTGDLRVVAAAFTAQGVVFAGASPQPAPTQLYSANPGAKPVPLTSGEGDKVPTKVNTQGTALVFTVRAGGGGRGGRGGGAGSQSFNVLTLADGKATSVEGSAPAFSADGASLAYVSRSGSENRLLVAPVANPADATVVRTGPERIDSPAFSPDGARIAFQIMPKEDWEIHVVSRDGKAESRVTREIQHDLLPQFLGNDLLLGAMGEGRHRRSHLYELNTGKRIRLFHNNTVRTIAPEYVWIPSADGQKLLIVAERDGDTVSVERGVYLVDLSRKVTRDELKARVKSNLTAEQALRSRTQKMFAPIANEVRTVVGEASIGRVYSYEKSLFDFDSKHITRPGNKLAGEYLFDKYKSFGYAPEYQWFAGRGALGGQTANVLATLKGTTNPELVYVVSSHYDSVAVGPGADDDSSGTAALLETARILAKHPQPATIIFASFTGEESGLLGSREFVRQAVANKINIVGALNNDMIGWANDHRLDNTIRYSNAGIRDIQHGAAMHFTDLITYDALYYKSTDAAAYYEAYGDIVGGIGSYPVLGNPHYHQSHDLLDTINHRLVTEVAKTTAATLMLLASSPARLADLKVDSFSNGTAQVSWTPSPEKGVTGYIVTYGPRQNLEAQQLRVTTPSARIPKVQPGMVISVKAVNSRGLEGWDWARVDVK